MASCRVQSYTFSVEVNRHPTTENQIKYIFNQSKYVGNGDYK